MKRILFISALLVSFLSEAQVKQKLGTYGVVTRRLKADSAIQIPTFQVGIKDAYAGFDTAQLMYKPVDSSVYVHTGFQWQRLARAAEIGTGYTFDNGLLQSGSTVGLGGTFLTNRSINAKNKIFTIDSLNSLNLFSRGTGADTGLFKIQINRATEAIFLEYSEPAGGKYAKIDLGYDDPTNVYIINEIRRGGVSLSSTIMECSDSSWLVNANKVTIFTDSTISTAGIVIPRIKTIPSATNMQVVYRDSTTGYLYRGAATGGGYTNLTQFVAQTAWRGFYSDGSGDVQEQAFGTSGKVWTSNGTTAAPTWETPSAGGTPAGNFGNLQINRNGAFVTPGSDSLDFESATGLTAIGGFRTGGSFGGVAQRIYDNASDLTISAYYATQFIANANGSWKVGSVNASDLGGFFATGTFYTNYTTILGQAGAGWNVGVGVGVPTGKLHIAASATGAGTGSIKINEGSRQTTGENGTINYVANNLEFTEGAGPTVYILAKTLTATATLDFGSTLAGTSTDLTVTVTGAADGQSVSLGVPNGSTLANGVFTAWVSASNTVTVRFSNNSLAATLDPASGTFRTSVIVY